MDRLDAYLFFNVVRCVFEHESIIWSPYQRIVGTIRTHELWM